MSKYGVLDKLSNIINHIFDDVDKAKQHIELEAINDFTERVECLRSLSMDHEKTLSLRNERTKRAKKKVAKKPVQKSDKKSKKKSAKDEELEDENNEQADEYEEDTSEPDYAVPTEDVVAELESIRNELADRYEMLLACRKHYQLVEITLL